MNTKIMKNPKPYRPGIALGIPTTGVIRYEWHCAMMAQIIPTNWQCTSTTAYALSSMGYEVAQARNTIVAEFLRGNREWLFFIDHDVLLPPHTFIWVDKYLEKPPTPIIGGLYYVKGYPASPLVYRGRGNSSFTDFKLGDKVWCDGMGMGCTLIHRSVLEIIWSESDKAKRSPGRAVFVTPREVYHDPETNLWGRKIGTEDLFFLDRVKDILKKTKWRHLHGRPNPFLVDTELFCRHVDINGTTFPLDIDPPPGYDAWMQRLKSKTWKVNA